MRKIVKKLFLGTLAAILAIFAPSAIAADGNAAKTLVVYYSASGTTAKAAKIIAENLGADIFEVKCAEPYTDADLDWTDPASRCCREHENPALRKVALAQTRVDGWENYETVFVGYPIWWGIAAWPLTSFVEANDFAGKTVIPFATAYSSGLGASGKLLAQSSRGKWLTGKRFYSTRIRESEIRKWLVGLGFAAKN